MGTNGAPRNVGDVLVETSEQDKREYAFFELPNKLKVLVVSDPTTDKAAAAIDVHVGQLHDPVELPGLAHFLEHLLFMGTEKYPNENAFSQFLSQHGGNSNAYTSLEHTNYYFDIQHSFLDPALDIFAQFFICPLFLENTKDREVAAVNSEHEKNLVEDLWRLSQLDRSTSNPSHPYSHFGNGNIETLSTIPQQKGINVRDELIKFHREYYSANVMCLCILGRESVDELKQLAVDKFSAITNKNRPPLQWEGQPYEEPQLKKMFCMDSNKEHRCLEYNFRIFDTKAYYRSKPTRYVCHLIGHEGPNSLLAVLKKRGWATALMAGEGKKGSGFGFLRVTIELTEAGMDHINDITLVLFQNIQLIKRQGVQDWIFHECHDLNRMFFRFKDKELPYNYVSSVANYMQMYPPAHVLSGPYMYYEYDPKVIRKLLNLLTPDNMRMFVVSKRFGETANKVERWYGTKYSEHALGEDLLKSWAECNLNPELAIPAPNEFIPTDFTIKQLSEDTASKHPVVVVETPHLRAWHKQDDVFKLPKAIIMVLISSRMAYVSPTHCVLTRLFSELLKDSLAEYAYAAELGGVTYVLENVVYGLLLNIQGYNHKLPVLLAKIVDKIKGFAVDDARFKILKDEVRRSYVNFSAEAPYQHCMFYTHLLSNEKLWSHKQKLDALEDVTPQQLASFVPLLLTQVHTECYIHGNVTREEARQLAHEFDPLCQAPPLSPAELTRHRHIKFEPGITYIYEYQEQFSSDYAIENYIVTGLDDSRGNVLVELASQIIHEKFGHVLRTQEQLGYIVHSGLRRQHGVNGLRFIVQGERDAAYLDTRIEVFLRSVKEVMEGLDEATFAKHINTLTTKKLEKDKSMGHEVNRYWSEILDQQYNFNRASIEVEVLKTVTKGDLLTFYREKISPQSTARQKLSSRSLSIKHKAAGEPEEAAEGASGLSNPTVVKITDVWEFKKMVGLYAQPKQWPYQTILD
eukprot:comp23732_c1_seq1/m.40925 comp23732_c1_seq1/g.40925  ORF comp23732_c1_seq1/g.40925 comp23732_c1_seq1/m.40925 type:complete len:972 (-) comp23732_c1_seq1:688-3603(-)